MSDHINKSHLTPLPESLRKQLEQFKNNLWRIKVTEALFAGILGLIISFAFVFALDRVWEIPAIIRLIILIAGLSLFAVFAPFWINRWIFKHRKENQLARLISKSYPDLGDRLLGVVELQDQKESQTALSPELRQAAMIAVAHDANSRNINNSLSSSWRNKLALGAMLTTGLCAVAFFIFPDVGENALKRWFMPLSDTKRYTFTKFDLSEISNPLYVPINEPFTITLPLDSNTQQTPNTAKARIGNGSWNSYPLNSNEYKLEFKGQRAKNSLYLKAGDANLEIKISPIKRPVIKIIQGLITYPEYLGRKPATEDLISGQIDILKGSKITISAKADRELKSAQVGPLVLEQALEEGELKETEVAITHEIDASTIISEEITITKNSINLPILWTDEYGITGSTAKEIKINSTIDLAPTTYIQDDRTQIYILHSEIVSLTLSAEDDYGIKSAGISWSGEFSSPAKTDERFIIGAPNKTNVLEAIEIDFIARKIAPQKLEVRSWVDDYNPATPRVYSEVIEVFLMTEAQHAEHLASQLDETIAKLDEAILREQENRDENERLLAELKDPAKANEATQQLAEQQIKEEENHAEMQKLAEEVEAIFQDAVKNKEIAPENIKDISDIAKEIKEIADKDMPEIIGSLKDAKSEKNTPEKTAADLKEAVKQQDELLKKMKGITEKANKTINEIKGSTFLIRLEQAASNEELVFKSLMPDDNVLNGLPYSELEPAKKRIYQNIYLLQKQTSEDIRWIIEDLDFFYTRTKSEKHNEIIGLIKKSSITSELITIEEEVALARAFIPMTYAQKIAKQLRQWAKTLKGEEEESQEDQEGDAPEDNAQAEENFEFMLKLMQIVQKEQNLRARTRALEQSKRNIESTDK